MIQRKPPLWIGRLDLCMCMCVSVNVNERDEWIWIWVWMDMPCACVCVRVCVCLSMYVRLCVYQCGCVLQQGQQGSLQYVGLVGGQALPQTQQQHQQVGGATQTDKRLLQ